MPRAEVLCDVAVIQAMAQPLRLKMLELLRQPTSAAALARTLGEPRQNVNYHLKALERAGLAEPAGEVRRGALTEQLYRARASQFLISPRFAWSGGRLGQTLQDQAALAALIDLGERISRDATVLLDRAAFDGEEIKSGVVEAELAFADGDARTAFMREYLEALGQLLQKYGSDRKLGLAYRVALAVYPETKEETVQ